MRRYLFLPSLTLVLFLSVFTNSIKAQRPNSTSKELWHGKITYIWRTAVNSPRLKATSEMFMEAVVAGSKATTRASETVNRREIDGNCVTTWEGYSDGAGTCDFEISMFEDGATIELPMPAIKGKKTIVYGCLGKTVTEFMGMNDIGMLVEGIKIRNDPNFLSGDSTQRTVTRNGDEVLEDEHIISWSFTRGPAEEELIITPHNYDQWLPHPGKSETDPGNNLTIQLRVQGKDGKAPRRKAKAFELELLGTSKEPGVALNVPLDAPKSAAFDMAFVGETSDHGQKLKIGCDDGLKGSATINAYDGGAYTTLVATAILEGGIQIQGHLEVPKGPTEIKLPKQEGESKIATAWLKLNGNPKDSHDSEKSLGNNNDGDGLTAYEEYRGLISESKFRRLDPLKKELGVHVRKQDKSQFEQGLTLFENASNVKVIRLYDDELGVDRELNKNSSRKTRQHALRLVDGRIGLAGENQPTNILNKRPKDSERVVIDLKHLDLEYHKQDSSYRAGGESMPFTHEENVAATVAHELAHGVGLDHHGPPQKAGPRTVYKGDRIYRIYGMNGREVGIDSFLYINPNIGVAGNEASGDLECIMAYNASYEWAYSKAADGTIIFEKVPLLPPGKRFCTSNTATGINAKGYFGNATSGNCMPKLKIKDE